MSNPSIKGASEFNKTSDGDTPEPLTNTKKANTVTVMKQSNIALGIVRSGSMA
jgi:hypothetical protein